MIERSWTRLLRISVRSERDHPGTLLLEGETSAVPMDGNGMGDGPPQMGSSRPVYRGRQEPFSVAPEDRSNRRGSSLTDLDRITTEAGPLSSAQPQGGSRPHRFVGLFLIVVVGSTLAVACSGTPAQLERSTEESPGRDETPGGKSAGRLTLHARDSVFAPKKLALPQGKKVTVRFVNGGELPHTFTIRDLGVDTGTVRSGASSVVSFSVPEANTPFVCTIHEFEGHVGAIVPT